MRLAIGLLVALVATAHARPAPRLASASVVAIDAATGAELFAHQADEPRPIASTTKLFAALALRAHHVDLDRATTIDHDDAVAGVGGAATVLVEGETFANSDLMYAMMLASDNRVPSALARSVGMSPAELLVAMRRVAADSDLPHTRFDDTTGILGNQSTAREMALAVRAAVHDRVLARYMTTRSATVTSKSGKIVGDYRSTVWPLWSKRWTIGGKTGHTDAAGYCMVIAVRLGDREVAMAFLGGATRKAVSDDFDALADYLDRHAVKFAVLLVIALGCSKPAPDATSCTCVPNNASRVGNLDGASLLAKLRRHVRDVAQGRNARDIKVDDDELRFAVANFCDPCNTWVTDRMTLAEMFPLARLDDAVDAVCLGLVLRDHSIAYGEARIGLQGSGCGLPPAR